jgi:hypothetical protein
MLNYYFCFGEKKQNYPFLERTLIISALIPNDK